MRKNSLRYKALKRCAQVNENVAVDLLKLKRAGVDVKNFVNQVENIDAPYSILENYNFMSIDDVDVHDGCARVYGRDAQVRGEEDRL